MTEVFASDIPVSRWTRSQTRSYSRAYTMASTCYAITALVRYDDACGNGHNTFSITAAIQREGLEYCAGCCHEEVAEYFPELLPLLKWHLVSSAGPLHYLVNAIYWAGHSGWRDGKDNSPPNLEHLKNTIVYGVLADDLNFDLLDCMYSDARGFTGNEAKSTDLQRWLFGRLPRLLQEFKKAIETMGLTY